RGRQREAAMRRVTLAVEAPAGFEVPLDADLFIRVIENLLDNALRYTDPDGHIRLRADAGPLGARVTVYNSGSGIPEKDRARIFEKYERLDTPRSSRGSNRGIGLYFCRLAVEAHRGTISVDDGEDDESGCRFLIDLPR